jgi:GNAT superfamily N-acetyltransferase
LRHQAQLVTDAAREGRSCAEPRDRDLAELDAPARGAAFGAAVAGITLYVSHTATDCTSRRSTSAPELVIAVAPEHRGPGIGGALPDELISQCSATYDALSSNVHQRNPASRLYERKGVRMNGPRRGALGIAMLREFS